MKKQLFRFTYLITLVLSGLKNSSVEAGWSCFGKKNRVQPVSQEVILAADAIILRQIGELQEDGLTKEQFDGALAKLVGKLQSNESYKKYIRDYCPHITLVEGQEPRMTKKQFVNKDWIGRCSSKGGHVNYLIACRYDQSHIFADASARPILRNKKIQSLWIVEQERLQKLAPFI